MPLGDTFGLMSYCLYKPPTFRQDLTYTACVFRDDASMSGLGGVPGCVQVSKMYSCSWGDKCVCIHGQAVGQSQDSTMTE